jgi:uncharacterized membrane protein YfcA
VNTRALWYVLAGMGAGLLAGFLGIGGGIVLVPVLAGALGLNQHAAHGTSLAVIIPIAAAGSLVYAIRGEVDWLIVAAIATASAAGAVAGARLMARIPAERLRQLFGVYAIAIAIVLLVGIGGT